MRRKILQPERDRRGVALAVFGDSVPGRSLMAEGKMLGSGGMPESRPIKSPESDQNACRIATAFASHLRPAATLVRLPSGEAFDDVLVGVIA